MIDRRIVRATLSVRQDAVSGRVCGTGRRAGPGIGYLRVGLRPCPVPDGRADCRQRSDGIWEVVAADELYACIAECRAVRGGVRTGSVVGSRTHLHWLSGKNVERLIADALAIRTNDRIRARRRSAADQQRTRLRPL